MTTQAQAATALRAGLAHFYGSEQLFRHMFSRAVYTEGVQYFAENAGAYWFIDILATEPAILAQARSFAAVTLAVAEGAALITVTDGNKKLVFSREIDFTDCPPGEWKFFFENLTIMLPGER